jgi:solute carrier family 25 oxoglutarate transporter 11
MNASTAAPPHSLSTLSSPPPPTTTTKTTPLPTRMVLAALSGCVAASLCHPLDTVRVQMQTSTGRTSSLTAAVNIYKTAGLQNGLYAGISAAYLRQWLYGSVRMGLYSYLLEQAQLKNEKDGKERNDITFSGKVRMACISGAIGSFVGTPSELALVRMTADSKLPVAERRNYTSVVDVITRCIKEEGFVKLWRGATPTVFRAMSMASGSLAITSELKPVLADSGYFGINGQWGNGYPMLFSATLVSSFFAAVGCNPFDVVKSRLQNMKINADGSAMYTGMMDCFSKSIKAEGISVLMAGVSFIRMHIHTHSALKK